MEGFAGRTSGASVPIYRFSGQKELDHWLSHASAFVGAGGKERSKFVKAWAESAAFIAKPGQHLLVPEKDGGLWGVLLGVSADELVWQCSRLPTLLPRGKYSLADCASADEAN